MSERVQCHGSSCSAVRSGSHPSLRSRGPKYVAGASYFDPLVMGQPIIWAQGQVNYYTDLGDLSPILPGASADTFVANAFSQWTSVSTAAINATRAASLRGRQRQQRHPQCRWHDLHADRYSTDRYDTPVGIVYDSDGSVTSALLGSGAEIQASASPMLLLAASITSPRRVILLTL